MTTLRRVCVFCGSQRGDRREYAEAAEKLGSALVDAGIGLVYGGGGVGLMGVVADAAMAAGGEVIGVIPDHLLARELGHGAVGDLRVVGSMHERKTLMYDLADGFITLPGGLGTLEETAEILTWSQLGLHAKPVGLLQVAGFHAPLVAFLDHAVAEGFVHPAHRRLLIEDDDPIALIERMAAWEPPPTEEWIPDADR